MDNLQLPEHITKIDDNEEFHFSCHPDVPCFTHCCRELELALTPFDVLRLRKGTALHSKELLERYIITEQTVEDVFPRFYLTMVDDGQASCVFVTENGCGVYEHRPGACRAYPLGRAAIQHDDGSLNHFHVLLKEPHCKGFAEKDIQTVPLYTKNQGLEKYNHFNDLIASILQHEKVKQGMRFTQKQISMYTLAMYDLDTFRQKLFDNTLENTPPLTQEQKTAFANDEALFLFAVQWIKQQLFEQV